MRRMGIFFTFCFLVFYSSPGLADNFTLTSYYPAPYAAYDHLRLNPMAALSEPCEIGLVYSENPGTFRYCRDDGGGAGSWAPVSIWTQNSDDVYPTDTATNPNLFAGIGTQTPGSRLTLKGAGDTNATSSLEVLDSTDRSLLFINDAGHVGIGTNSPASPLELKHAVDPYSNSVPPLMRLTNQAGFTEPVEFRLDAYYGAGRLLSSTAVGVLLDYDDDGLDSVMTPRTGFEILKNTDVYQASDADDENLMVVKQNAHVGIGQSARFPAAHLEVSASGGTDDLFMLSSDDTDGDIMTVKNDGKVGIGTNDPKGDLHVDKTDPRVVIGDLTSPIFPLEIKTSTSSDLTDIGWFKAIKIENTGNTGGALVWSEIPGVTPNNFFMTYPSFSPAGDFFMGFVDTLDGTTLPDYVMKVYGQSRAGEPSQASVEFMGNAVAVQKMGIGWASNYVPTEALDVNGNIAVSSGQMTANDFCINGGGDCLEWHSDRDLKQDIHPMDDNSLERLLRLKGVSFEWKDPEALRRSAGRHIGFIAQDVEGVFPQWVRTNPQGYKTISKKEMKAVMVESFRELKGDFDREIKTLNAELDELIQENQELKKALLKRKGTL